MFKISLFWFKRDLRLEDNRGLFAALNAGLPVLPIFIFDTNILNRLSNKADARVSFIYNQVESLKEKIEKLGGSFYVAYGNPVEIIDRISILFSFDFNWFINLGSNLFYSKKGRFFFKLFIN
jgi:deoxyribodipyrimidine photo-lyase